MAAVINTNIASLNTQRNLSTSQSSLNTSIQRLSSGLRVNSAKDDAAGLAIAERMNSQIKGMNVAIRNANDAISLSQTAEGALGKIGENLQRMRELAVQGANGTNSDTDLASLQKEYTQLSNEVTRVIDGTKFNGKTLLNNAADLTFQVGANNTSTDQISVTLSDLSTDTTLTDVTGATAAKLTTVGTSQATLDANVTSAQAAVTTATTAKTAADANVTTATTAKAAADANVTTADTAATGLAATAVTAAKALALDPTDVPKQTAAAAAATAAAGGSAAEQAEWTAYQNAVTAQATAQTNLTTATTAQTTAGNAVTTAQSAVTTAQAAQTAGPVVSGAQTALDALDKAIETVSSARATFGAVQNRFEAVIGNLQIAAENQSSSRSRIIDADFASETSNLTRGQILQQAGTAMLAQANSLPNGVMALLRG